MKDKNKQNREVANSLVMVLQFGINVIVPILLCTVVGAALTKAFGSKCYTIAGILIVILASFNVAYRSVKVYLKNEESPGQRARRLEEEAKQSGEEHD
ncbi:MAG: AtpZ/AtpI family protein [Pseudobutyrivibrio sp.]|nr:AtpZ/AtpI family protein [Pseudobutyrivibrio sp.]